MIVKCGLDRPLFSHSLFETALKWLLCRRCCPSGRPPFRPLGWAAPDVSGADVRFMVAESGVMNGPSGLSWHGYLVPASRALSLPNSSRSAEISLDKASMRLFKSS